MLKTPRGPSSKAPRSWSLVVFSVGGRSVAARAEEVLSVLPWTEGIPVPSGTAFVNAVLRHGDDVLPVFDLAAKLRVQVRGAKPLCVIAKRRDGPMAICIDAEIPSLQTVEVAAIRPTGGGSEVTGSCLVGAEEVPIYSLTTLGLASAPRGQA
jgi:chemotaxis signal transduction protein